MLPEANVTAKQSRLPAKLVQLYEDWVHPAYHVYVFGIVILSPVIWLLSKFEFVSKIFTTILTFLFGPLVSFFDIHPVQATSAVATLCGFVAVLALKLRRARRAQTLIFEVISQSNQAQRLFVDKVATLLDTSAPSDQIDALIGNHVTEICDRIEHTFEALTHAPCSASIKWFDVKTGNVKPYARDRRSIGRRSADEVLASYNYKKNTAFRLIIDDQSVSHFCSNHLVLRSLLGYYDNDNPNCAKSYVATCVVPVARYSAAAKIDGSSVLAFVCVDNQHGGLHRKSAAALLTLFAQQALETMEIVSDATITST